MRIYRMDGVICFDTDDFRETRLLDEYAAQCAEVGSERAANRIALWIASEESGCDVEVATFDAIDVARRIRAGEWKQ